MALNKVTVDDINFKGKKVLVADDMYVNRRIISEMLTAAGAVVETAVGGLDAVSMALSEKYDLILMDIIMPVVDRRAADPSPWDRYPHDWNDKSSRPGRYRTCI